jgi:predicted glutamine amidotransferase
MCRWLAYSGSPILMEELLYRPRFSLIDQSLHARHGAQTTNGDGFGVGWYPVDRAHEPTVFRGTGPAWGDPNLRELAGSIRTGLFLAHIRASTGTAVQQTNCHPFRYGRWLWLHNGLVRGYAAVKRELTLAVDPELFPAIAGSTDSELMFYLALTFGLTTDPVAAVQRMVAHVETVGWRHGVENPLQMTVATTDGQRLWAFRYSSENDSRSLYYSTDVTALRSLYPENERFSGVSEETRIVVSEPLSDLSGAWQTVPESSFGVIQEGADELGPFRPTSA